MSDYTIRLAEIQIRNFKNVQNGQLTFYNRRKKYEASVLGIYGQNGSGKTALINALDLLQDILQGRAVSDKAVDYISIDAEYADLKYTFDVSSDSVQYRAVYEFYMKKELDIAEQNADVPFAGSDKYKAVLYNEVLSCSYTGNIKKSRMSQLVNTDTDEVFVPASKYDLLVGNKKETEVNLMVAKQMAANSSRSFVFSRELLKALKERNEEVPDNLEFTRYLNLIQALEYYGNNELFVLDTKGASVLGFDLLPLAFKYEKDHKQIRGQILLPLEGPAVLPQDVVDVAERVVSDMNTVLQQIIPGLKISINVLDTISQENGQPGCRIELMSNKNQKTIPLRCESEGIKKIIYILHLLIGVYNQTSITVAIDELDSGVFEYLLGEILRIISEKGKGQLIFTSHNLRPLETIDRGFIAFTTTNPSNRYVRLTNLKDNNNVRDLYFRNIILGEQQKEELYEMTHNAEIAFAFREAGELGDS